MRFQVLSALLIALFTVVFVSAASATVFEFDCRVARTCPTSDGAGQMVASVFSLDDNTLDFSWTATFDIDGTETPNGVWFTINHGPEPRRDGEGIAIFYGDGDTGRVSAYVYDNDRRKMSWEDESGFLDTYENAISFTPLGGSLVGLDIAFNVADVNNAFPTDPSWQGLFYEDTIGFWAAALSDTDMRFDNDGRLTFFGHDERTSYDRSNRLTVRIETEPMPEPATLFLLCGGLVGIGVLRKRR